MEIGVGQNNDKIAGSPAALNTELIKEYRALNRLTQGDLATMLEITSVTLSRWEKHKTFPSKTHLKKIAKILDVNMSELVIVPKEKGSWSSEKSIKMNPSSYVRHESPKNAGTQLLLLLFELHNLINEHISCFDKESELAIYESILNNSLILIKNQKNKIKLQSGPTGTSS